MQLLLRAIRFKGHPISGGPEACFDGRGGSIGRSDDCYLVVPDPTRVVSGRHAVVMLREDRFYVVDTSQNGVFVNASEEPVGWCRAAELIHGETVGIGEYEFRIRIVAEGSAEESMDDLTLVLPVVAPVAGESADEPPPRPQAAEGMSEGPQSTPVPHAGMSEREDLPAERPPALSGTVDALVVDDDEDLGYLVKFMLERAGYTVQIAMDGMEAKRLIEGGEPPRVAVLDVLLPHFDGFQLIEMIRTSESWRKTPVVMLSAMSSERDIVRALSAGADDYIAKPFKPVELVARLTRFLA